jgi:hypothetical protein
LLEKTAGGPCLAHSNRFPKNIRPGSQRPHGPGNTPRVWSLACVTSLTSSGTLPSADAH